ncbi:hypothetical protein Q7P37_005229 [Cladosporium fusiforme]
MEDSNTILEASQSNADFLSPKNSLLGTVGNGSQGWLHFTPALPQARSQDHQPCKSEAHFQAFPSTATRPPIIQRPVSTHVLYGTTPRMHHHIIQ